VTDRTGWVAMGGAAERLGAMLEQRYPDAYPKELPDLGAAVSLGHEALASAEERELVAEGLEVAVLDRTRARRKFRRLTTEEVRALL
jgi:proteasome alpha subunit